MLGTLMRGWAGIVESAALLAIIILAFGVMVRAVKLGDTMKYLGTIVGVVILLVLLPGIIIAIWSTMSLWEHFGVALIAALIISFLLKTRNVAKSHRR